jgi:ribonuclease P protein component
VKGPSKARFQQIYSEGRRLESGSVGLRFLPGEGLLGITTHRAIGSRARRNRQKRRLREAWLSLAPPAGFDVIIVGRSQVQDLSFSDLQALMRLALSQWEPA